MTHPSPLADCSRPTNWACVFGWAVCAQLQHWARLAVADAEAAVHDPGNNTSMRPGLCICCGGSLPQLDNSAPELVCMSSFCLLQFGEERQTAKQLPDGQ